MTAARRGTRLLSILGVALAMTWGLAAPAGALRSAERRVFLFRVPSVSFEQLLSIAEVAAMARAGGAALLSYGGNLPLHGGTLERAEIDEMEYVPTVPSQLSAIGDAIRDRVLRFGAPRVLVIVVGIVPSPAMAAAKDELHPIVLARGAPAELFPQAGEPRSLASDATRRTGVVTDLDVLATIGAFLGEPLPDGGSVLRIVDEPAPFDLHARYLAMRRMSVPVQTAAGVYVTVVGLVTIALLALRRRAPTWLGGGAAWLALSVAPLAVALLAAGHLPTLSYATVMPLVIVVTLVGTFAFAPLRRRGPLVPAAAIGVAVLAYFLVEATVGWTGALTPFLGGSELDGGRFYGLPNVFIGLLIGSSLYVAHRLEPVPGFLLVVAVALFAGLPWTGANLGGSVALFAAAGLWLPLRRTGWIGPRGLALAAVVVVGGAGVVLLAHRFLTSVPTHVTRFEESPGGLAGAWETFVDRLLVGWRLILRNPFALVPVLGLFAVLWVLFHPPARIAEVLHRHSEWSDALVVTLLASAVAYVANDSGPAAAGLGFGLALGGLLHVSLSERTWKIEAT